MIEFVIATGNRGKLREFREMLGEAAASISDLAGTMPEVEETGATFLENASLKASAYALHFKRWALADDSGLEVFALNGAPGVYSARWAQRHHAGNGDADNNRLLLVQLANVADADRGGQFVCVLALSDPHGKIILTARGVVAGRILREPRGSGGFGYDPLFFIDELGKTTAELSSDQKHAISHRGHALREMRKLMEQARLL